MSASFFKGVLPKVERGPGESDRALSKKGLVSLDSAFYMCKFNFGQNFFNLFKFQIFQV